MQPEKWEILHSQYLVDDHWLRLRSDKCRLPNGKIIDPFYITEYVDWVNIVALTPDQDIVLVRQYRHGRGRIALELPGGMIETGQTPELAAQRELIEETGYSSEKWIKLGSVCANPDSHTNLSHAYLALDAIFTREQQLDENEFIEVEKMGFQKFVKMALSSQIDQALHVTSCFWALMYLQEHDL